MPFRVPSLTGEEIRLLTQGSFQNAVAGVLNLLFGTKVTPWEVECCIGRYPVRLGYLDRKTFVAELWHNPQEDLSWLLSSVAMLLGTEDIVQKEGNWVSVGIRMALLSGVCSLLRSEGWLPETDHVDLAVTSGDFSSVMSIWYAKQLGLPIGKVICCCNDDGALWELVYQGQLRTDRITRRTNTPQSDGSLPVGLERLIYECGGAREVEAYLDASRSGGMYCPQDRTLERMRATLQVSVVGQKRVEETVPSVYSSCGYVLSPYSALCFAGLQDRRAISGERRLALVMADRSPMQDADFTAAALGISVNDLKQNS